MKINWLMVLVSVIMAGAAIQFLIQGNKPAAGMMFFVSIGNLCGAFMQ